MIDLEGIEGMSTETRNDRTMELDAMPLSDLLRVMNDEDSRVAGAVREELPHIEEAVRRIVASFKAGGRLIYMGAGTSGRLGILDAAECVPTFGVPPSMVVGLIAGGKGALTKAVEGAEDNCGLGAQDLERIGLEPRDSVVGIAASGRTPYVLGGLDYARKVGAITVAVSCNKDSLVSKAADVAIEVVPGPEVLTGSTRLKAGTAQKLVLNMISTASMVGIGKVYKNLMVDVVATNNKLKVRAENIVMTAAEVGRETARKALAEAEGSCKAATVMLLLSCGKTEAARKLQAAEGHVRKAVERRAE
ncbi:MAG: N-acetylmuramic acid 6-phosphate etherase [Synergistaceae bacterium]|jgi:N-acetylmuramic acid 6-phosphate etherase|nr:N-acetylmuramic acid 6-phosphate etherase [Synergistaceae bacterium]